MIDTLQIRQDKSRIQSSDITPLCKFHNCNIYEKGTSGKLPENI